jgi:hypothetical protein
MSVGIALTNQFVVITLFRMAKKRGPGRPKAPTGKARSKLLQTRISPAEQRAFGEAAALDGKDVSEWVRDRLRRLARDELLRAGKSDPFLS